MMDLNPLDQLLDQAERLLRLGQLHDARPILDKAQGLAHKNDDRQGEAQVLMWRGDLEDRAGNPQMARDLLAEARALYASQGEQANQARVLMRLATLAKTQGQWDEAQSLLNSAVIMYEAAQNWQGMGRAQKRLGHLALRQGNRPAAKTAFAAAAIHCRQGFDLVGEVNALIELSHLASLDGNLDEAYRELRRALEVARQAGDGLSEGLVLKNLGLVRLQMGDDHGLAHLREATHVFAAAGDLAKEAECLLLLAKSESHLQRAQTARLHAAKIYTRLGRYEVAAKIRQRVLTMRGQNPSQTP